MVEENTTETAKKPRKAARKRSAAPSRTSAAKLAMVPVEYLIDYGEAKKGETGKLPVSEAWRLSWANIVRQTNQQK